MSKKYTGHCACGLVTWGFDSEPSFVANCHCTVCKRAQGSEAWSREKRMPPLDVPQFDHAPQPDHATS